MENREKLNFEPVAYKDNGETLQARWTDKLSRFEKIAIKGVRWCDSFGVVYHKAYISALDKESQVWEEIGQTHMASGGDQCYLITAGAWLIHNGYLEARDGYALGGWPTRYELGGIEFYTRDVKRKRDM